MNVGLFIIIAILELFLKQVSGWEIFEHTIFQWEYDEDLGLEVQIPYFDEKVKELEDKEITLTGHYLPFQLDGERIILSKLPYAACFFCGGGVGSESVAEVTFSSVQRPFRMDELVTIRGRLRFNTDDYEHLAFMIVDAKEL